MCSRDGTEEAESSNMAISRVFALTPAPRVCQVDADELDEGLSSMLGERVDRAISNFRGSEGLDMKPEISLLLKIVVCRFGVLDPAVRASPGAKLQNLKIEPARGFFKLDLRRTLLLYLFLHPPIFPTYVLTRVRRHALSRQWPDLPAHDWRRKAWRAITRLETAAKAWELAGWGWFLWDGQYPSLLMRMLGLRLVPSSAHLTKLVSYEFMNRQLVWSAFTEFLMFSVPLLPTMPKLLSPLAVFQPLKSFFSQPTSIDYHKLPIVPRGKGAAANGGASNRAAHSGRLAGLPPMTCPICHQRKSSTPVPIASSSAGANISLPPIPHLDADGSSADGLADGPSADIEEETRIFAPAETDCWGGCRWCYYCIAEELVKHRERLAASKKAGKPVAPEEEKWTCLRCGGQVTSAWRAGSDSVLAQTDQPSSASQS